MEADGMHYQSRRSLALKKSSRSQERDEALLIQRAMEESLREANSNKGTPFDSERPTEKAKSTKKEAGNHKKEVIDSEEDRPLEKNGMSIHGCNPSDVVLSEEVEEDDEGEVPQKGRSSAIQVLQYQQINKKTNDPVEWSSDEEQDDDDDGKEGEDDSDDVDDEEEEEDDDDDDATEGESSDSSEDLRRKRKKAPASKLSKARVVKDRKQVPVPQVKKARSTRMGAKERPVSSDPVNKIKSVMQVTPSEKVKTLKEMETNVSLTKKCQGSVKQSISGSAMLFDHVSSPSLAIFQPQSPTLIHRRVIGLSRRFRPPPLHPYLSNIQS